MAKAEKPDKQETPVAPVKRRRIPPTALIVGGVALGEAVLFYGALKMFGGPEAAHGAEAGEHYTQGEDPTQEVITSEIPLLDGFRVPNDKRGQAYLYELEVYLKVRSRDQEMVTAFVESHRGEICDRVARIVRAADPTMLHEPELKTLRLKVRHTLEEVLGDSNVIVEVLIPKCMPMRAG